MYSESLEINDQSRHGERNTSAPEHVAHYKSPPGLSQRHALDFIILSNLTGHAADLPAHQQLYRQ